MGDSVFSLEVSSSLIGMTIFDWNGLPLQSDKDKILLDLVNAFTYPVVANYTKSATDATKFFTAADFISAGVNIADIISYYESYTLFMTELIRLINLGSPYNTLIKGTNTLPKNIENYNITNLKIANPAFSFSELTSLYTIWNSDANNLVVPTKSLNSSADLDKLVALLSPENSWRSVTNVMKTTINGGLGMTLKQIYIYARSNPTFNSKQLVLNSSLLTEVLADLSLVSPTLATVVGFSKPTVQELQTIGASVSQIISLPSSIFAMGDIIERYTLSLVHNNIGLSGPSGYTNFLRLTENGQYLNRVFITTDSAVLYGHLSSLYDTDSTKFGTVTNGMIQSLNNMIRPSIDNSTPLNNTETKILSIITTLKTMRFENSTIINDVVIGGLLIGSNNLIALKSIVGLSTISGVWTYIVATYGNNRDNLLNKLSGKDVTASGMTLVECVNNFNTALSQPIFSLADYYYKSGSIRNWDMFTLKENFTITQLVTQSTFLADIVSDFTVNDSFDIENLISNGLPLDNIKTEYNNTTEGHTNKDWLYKSNITFDNLKIALSSRLYVITNMQTNGFPIFGQFSRSQKRSLFPNTVNVAGSGIRLAENIGVSRYINILLKWTVSDYIAAGYTYHELLNTQEKYVKYLDNYEIDGIYDRNVFHTNASRIAIYNGYYPEHISDSDAVKLAAIDGVNLSVIGGERPGHTCDPDYM